MSAAWALAGLSARPMGNAWAWLCLAWVVARCLAVWPLEGGGLAPSEEGATDGY